MRTLAMLLLVPLLLAAMASGPWAEPAEHHEVVIVGGGIAGLSAAHHLDGRDVLLLEKEPRVGGRALSGMHQGYWYARGAEYIGQPYGALKTIVHDLGIPLLPISPPMDMLWADGKFYQGFQGLLDFLTRQGGKAGLKRFYRLVMRQYARFEEFMDALAEGQEPDTTDLESLDRMTAGQWLADNNFPETYRDKYQVAARGLFGANLDEISALSLFEEAAFDFEGFDPDELDEDWPPDPLEDEEAYTFPGGLAALCRAMAQGLGPAVRTGCAVVTVEPYGAEPGPDGGYVVTYRSNGQEFQVAADVVILAVPAPVAAGIAEQALPVGQLEIARAVRYAPYATCALFFSEPVFTQAFDLALPGDFFFTDLYDCTWVQRNTDPDADPEVYINSAYIAPQSYQDASILEMSDQEIVDRVLADLERVFPGARGKLTGYDIQRFPLAYPVMTPGTLLNLARLPGLGNGTLLLAGDWTAYPTFEAACDSGHIAAERALKALGE